MDDIDERIVENRKKLIELAKEKGVSQDELEQALVIYDMHTLTYYQKVVSQAGFERGYEQARKEERKRIIHRMRECGMTADEILDVIMIDIE